MKKIVVLLLLVIGLVSCGQLNNQAGTPPPPPSKDVFVSITFAVKGSGGTITATTNNDGNIFQAGSIKVKKNTKIIFTATPADNYKIDSWSIPTTDSSKKTAILVAAVNTDVYVTFKEIDFAASENKNIASDKKHIERDAWIVSMSGSKDNFTSKISNNTAFISLKAENNMIPMFVILKDIEKSGEIKFLISVAITSNEHKIPSLGKDIQIKLADNSIMEFDCLPHFGKTNKGYHRTTLVATISLKEINFVNKIQTPLYG